MSDSDDCSNDLEQAAEEVTACLGVVVLVDAEGRALGQPLAQTLRRLAFRGPVAKVASAATTGPLRFFIKAWPR